MRNLAAFIIVRVKTHLVGHESQDVEAQLRGGEIAFAPANIASSGVLASIHARLKGKYGIGVWRDAGAEHAADIFYRLSGQRLTYWQRISRLQKAIYEAAEGNTRSLAYFSRSSLR